MSDALPAVVRRIASDILGVPASQLTDDSSPDTIESWDSVQHLSLVMAFEQELGLQFEPEDMAKMRSIAAIVEMVRSKRGG